MSADAYAAVRPSPAFAGLCIDQHRSQVCWGLHQDRAHTVLVFETLPAKHATAVVRRFAKPGHHSQRGGTVHRGHNSRPEPNGPIRLSLGKPTNLRLEHGVSASAVSHAPLTPHRPGRTSRTKETSSRRCATSQSSKEQTNTIRTSSTEGTGSQEKCRCCRTGQRKSRSQR